MARSSDIFKESQWKHHSEKQQTGKWYINSRVKEKVIIVAAYVAYMEQLTWMAE